MHLYFSKKEEEKEPKGKLRYAAAAGETMPIYEVPTIHNNQPTLSILVKVC